MVENSRTLQQLVDENGLCPADEVARYVRLVAERVRDLHECNVVHKHLRPSTIALTDSGHIIFLGVPVDKEQDQLSFGDPARADTINAVDYLAPEQATDGGHVDGRSDIYSLGCILYFLLVGHPPFADGALMQRLVHHQTKEVEFPHSCQRAIPARLVEICKVMTAKAPENRFQTAEDVVAALSGWTEMPG